MNINRFTASVLPISPVVVTLALLVTLFSAWAADSPVYAVTFLSENFDSAAPSNLPNGWSKAVIAGTGDWLTNAGTLHPEQPAHSGANVVVFNSYNAFFGSSALLYSTTALDFRGVSAPALTFWMYHDTQYFVANDRVQPQVSLDGGSLWIDVGSAVSRYNGATGWGQHTVDLSAYASHEDVRIGFLGISAYGNDCNIDDVEVNGYLLSEIGVFRNGTWFADSNGNGAWDGCGTDGCWSLGITGDIPFTVPGGGMSLIGLFRDGTWFVDSGNHSWDGCLIDGCYSFGMAGDAPVMGDWAGIGPSMGVFRNGTWFIDYNRTGVWEGCGADACWSFGSAGDIPVVGDWNDSGTSKVAVFSNGTWFQDYNGNSVWDGCGTDSCLSFGMAGDIPVVGDWNGSGTIKIGVYRNGTWFLDYNGNSVWDGCGTDACYSFGASGDKPVTGIW